MWHDMACGVWHVACGTRMHDAMSIGGDSFDRDMYRDMYRSA